MCTKCDMSGKVSKLCPVSLGLAVGIVCFFAVLIWTVWVMAYGLPPMMLAMNLPVPTFGVGLVHALLALVKGFLFGFFIALIYDCVFCGIMKCKKSDGNCARCSSDTIK